MKMKHVVTQVMLVGGIAAAAIVPRLGADQGIMSKGDETSTFRATGANPQAFERAQAEKAARIEARRDEETAAFMPDGGADAPPQASPKGVDGALVTEALLSSAIQVIPADGKPTKLPPFSTIEIGPAELSAAESEKAELVLR